MDQRIAETLFPFYFQLNKELTIISAGTSLEKMCPDIINRDFGDFFKILRPNVPELNFEKLLDQQNKLILLYLSEVDVTLRGQIFSSLSGERLTFAVSIWLTSLDKLGSLRLDITDFALHDPMIDLLTLIHANNMTNQDLKIQTVMLDKAKKEALQALSAKRDFLSVMTHELRTPLNAVLGLTHILLDEDPRPGQLDHLNTLKYSAENLLMLINDMLDFNKLEAGNVEVVSSEFNLSKVATKVIEHNLPKAQAKNLEILFHIDTEIPQWLKGDPDKIGQILYKLIDNGIKFTAAGKVSLRLSLDLVTEEKVKVLFEIEDTGIGISEEKQKEIFKGFYHANHTTNRKYDGSGLGLAISQEFAELMDSQIFVRSKEGKGSCFFFYLDLIPASPPKAIQEASPSPQQVTSLKGFKVLVAEDNPVNAKIVSRFLKKWEIEFEVASNGQYALDKMKKDHFDLVLMDLLMPEVDGYEASLGIRCLDDPKKQKIPIIALSASIFEEVEDKLLEIGINDFIGKPFKPPHLKKMLQKYLSPQTTTERLPNLVPSEGEE